MSIFGTNNAKFRCEDIEVDLPHSMLEPTFIQSEEAVNISIVDGTKNFIPKGDYADFEVTVYLFKYDNPSAKISEILTYNKQLVYFYPYSDGDCLKDKQGNDVLVYISDVSVYPLKSKDQDDVCIIRFKPTKYVKYGTTTGTGYGTNYGYDYGNS